MALANDLALCTTTGNCAHTLLLSAFPYYPSASPSPRGPFGKPAPLGRKPMSNFDPDELPHRGSYRDATIHCDMLLDVVRTAGYQQAISEEVKPGYRVIDFGAGTGVLSIFSARAGAAQVDAIEREAIVGKAREIARLNQCPQIQYHATDHRSFETDGRVDVIVSEWMGHCLFHESMLEPLIVLRDRWLKPDGVMLPRSVSVVASLVVDDELHREDSFLQGSPYGIQWGSIAELPLRQSRVITLQPREVLLDRCELGTLDMKTVTETPESLDGTMTVSAEVTTYGVVAWFDVELNGEVRFGTGPHDVPTHWRQIYLPFPEPMDVSPQRPIHITIRPPRNVEESEQAWSWRVTDGVSTREVDEQDTFERSRSRDAVT